MTTVTNGTLNISRNDLDKIIGSDLTPEHMKSIFRVARDSKIGFMSFLHDSTKVDMERLNAAKAFVAIIDDNTECSLGPDHFEAALVQRLLEKAYGITVMSGTIVEDVYALFAEMAGLLRKGMVIIETRPEHKAQWIECLTKIAPNAHLIFNLPKPEKASKHS